VNSTSGKISGKGGTKGGEKYPRGLIGEIMKWGRRGKLFGRCEKIRGGSSRGSDKRRIGKKEKQRVRKKDRRAD